MMENRVLDNVRRAMAKRRRAAGAVDATGAAGVRAPAEVAGGGDRLDGAAVLRRGRLVPAAMPEADRVALFLSRAASNGARAAALSSGEALRTHLREVLPAAGTAAAGRFAAIAQATGWSPAQLLPEGWTTMCHEPERTRADLFRIDAALTGASGAIAETGSIVLDAGPELARWSSLAARIHVVILLPEQIMPDLVDWSARPPASLLISGPSKTADIEMNLVVGVHGPAELHVLVLQPAPA
ncbi:MAG: hypothetical protein GF355_02620 [Candidatus Eisenbacteria bacterium]|nr:hypothetical protein [Candidatus Eisenbacteria bacterium]